MAKSSAKKRKVIVEAIGEAHITASFNNIIISTNKYQDFLSFRSLSLLLIKYQYLVLAC